MNGRNLDGYRFEFRVQHLGPARGEPRAVVIAVAHNLAEAFVAAAKVMPVSGLRLVDRGPDVLAFARENHVPEGQATAFQA